MGALFFAATAAVADSTTNEPLHHGHWFDSWLQDIYSGEGGANAKSTVVISNMLPSALPFLLKQLKGPPGLQKSRAIQELTWLGPAAKAVAPDLARMLADASSPDGTTIIVILTKMGADAAPALIDTLKKTPLANPKLPKSQRKVMNMGRGRIVLAIREMGPAAREAIPILLSDLNDDDESVREAAVRALGAFADHNPEVTSVLLKCLKDPDEPTRQYAAFALAFGPKSPSEFRREMRQPDYNPLSNTAALLPADPAVVSALRTMALQAPEPSSREAATDSLMALDPANTLTELCKNLMSPEVVLRRNSARDLAFFKKGATNAIPLLIKCMADDDAVVKQNAAMALGEIAEQPDLVIPVLTKGLSNPDAKTRVASASALGAFGGAAKPAAPKIIELIKNNRDPIDADGYSSALYKIDPDAAERLEEAQEKDPAPVEMTTPVDMTSPNELR